MKTILTKRVYQPAEQSDGYRVLVDRLWPRGMSKERLPYDLWAKNIAPTPDLRQWYHQDIINHWAEFQTRYVDELSTNPYTDQFIDKISDQPTVTLLYAAADRAHNHADVLRAYLEKRENLKQTK